MYNVNDYVIITLKLHKIVGWEDISAITFYTPVHFDPNHEWCQRVPLPEKADLKGYYSSVNVLILKTLNTMTHIWQKYWTSQSTKPK